MATAKPQMIAMLSQALEALRAGRVADAEALSRELLATSPRDAAALQLTGNVAFRLGRFDEAEAHARASLAVRPRHGPTILLAGRAARARGDHAGAKIWFRQATDVTPAGAEGWFLLAVAQVESADPEFAATRDKLVGRFPAEAEHWREIGVAAMRRQRLEDAEAAFALAAAASDDPAHAVNLGRAMLARGRAAEAADALRRARARAPESLEPLLPLAQALRLIGAPNEARAALARLTQARPDVALAFYTLGLVCDASRSAGGDRGLSAVRRTAARDAGSACQSRPRAAESRPTRTGDRLLPHGDPVASRHVRPHRAGAAGDAKRRVVARHEAAAPLTPRLSARA